MRATRDELARAFAHPSLGSGLEAPLEPDDIPCALARRTCRIAPNGDVYPCSTYPTPVGNLLERPFADIWAGGPLLDRLRAIRTRDLVGDCQGCAQSGYCGRCAAVALIEHGDDLGPVDECCRMADAREVAAGLEPRTRAAQTKNGEAHLHLPILR
jgi:radical SAM protein with 4Fe4S-binding SPASM domain